MCNEFGGSEVSGHGTGVHLTQPESGMNWDRGLW